MRHRSPTRLAVLAGAAVVALLAPTAAAAAPAAPVGASSTAGTDGPTAALDLLAPAIGEAAPDDELPRSVVVRLDPQTASYTDVLERVRVRVRARAAKERAALRAEAQARLAERQAKDEALELLEEARRSVAEREAYEAARTPTFATVAGVPLRLPAREVRHVGFHEGPTAARAFSPTVDGASWSVMPSRGRQSAPTSAVDVAMAKWEPVRAPVDGRVVAVRGYQLYGTTPDLIVEVEPDAAPGVTVQVLHVRDVVVSTGQRVEGGVTVLAGSARQLPFHSQIDTIVGHRGPHVHLQVAG